MRLKKLSLSLISAADQFLKVSLLFHKMYNGNQWPMPFGGGRGEGRSQNIFPRDY